MSRFSILVQDAPYASQAATSALHFTRAALAAGHEIRRLFFYQGGALNASALLVPPQDELHLPRAWQELIVAHGIDAVVCVSSALRYGVLSEGEAERYGLPSASLLPGFNIGGLGQWVEAMLDSDRHLSFRS
jgi:tRNA 2-thiouridine synthesizing protein D